MKKLLLLVFWCLSLAISLAQSGQDTIPREHRDTPRIKRDTPRVKRDTSRIKHDTSRIKHDTFRGKRDTFRIKKDTAARLLPDTVNAVAVPVDSVQVAKPPVIQKKRDADIPAASVMSGPPMPDVRPSVQGFQKALQKHPYFNFYGRGVVITEHLKKSNRDEPMFYFLAALLFYFGFIRVVFMKYLHNLNTLFFRVTMRQQQIRDQVLQSPLPSLFLNILFIVSVGLFLTFVADYYTIVPGMNRWLLLLYCCLLLTAIYVGKFIVLKMIGWMFNIRQATDTYIFIVFLVNKMMGIYLLPVLLFMAFAEPPFLTVLLTLSYVFIGILFIYRFIIAYRPIRNEIKITRFHFFIYLCAFEIAPLLLIYKVLLIFVERSY